MRSSLPLAAALVLVAGCFGGSQPNAGPDSSLPVDIPLQLPDTDFFNRTGKPAYAGGPAQGMTPLNPAEPFHTLEEISEHVAEYALHHPGIARVDVIGKSLQGRPIWDVVVTNASNDAPKPTVLIDGGHHGNEIAGTELALYTLDFLLHNYPRNATARELVDTLEIHVVPLVNPDGYGAQTRGNALGVNLNRNYDVDWGNPYGASNPVMGTVAHATGQPVQSVPIVAENCGNAPFSEPESSAVRDLMQSLGNDFAVYLTFHTPTNGIVAPWSAGEAPFVIPPNENAVFESELQWVRDHTEYAAGKAQWGNFSAGLPYSASGSSQDWAYLRHHVAAYTLEVEFWVTSIVDPVYLDRTLQPYAGLPYWMQASLPIPWHILVNAWNYHSWGLPTRDVALPPGVPPPVPTGGWDALADAGFVKPVDEGAPEDPGQLLRRAIFGT